MRNTLQEGDVCVTENEFDGRNKVERERRFDNADPTGYFKSKRSRKVTILQCAWAFGSQEMSVAFTALHGTCETNYNVALEDFFSFY